MFARRVAPLLLLFAVGCACPPLNVSYATPLDTLATFQAQLCREDAQGEYACFSETFQRSIGGFENYYAGRALLLEEAPIAMLLLLKHGDLGGYVVEERVDEETGRAVLVLEGYDGSTVTIGFERNWPMVLHFEDGSILAASQDLPPDELIVEQRGRFWLSFDMPLLTPARLARLRSLSLESPWRIASISDLQLTTPEPTP